jgi:hypothetical protein
MWSLVPRKFQLTILIGGGIVAAWAYDAVVAYFTGHLPPLLKAISFAILVVGTGAGFVAEHLWRSVWRILPFLQTLVFPDLNGKWTGMLISTATDPSTGHSPPPIPIDVTIRQGLFSTSVSMRTGESTSHSTRAFLEPFRDTGRFRIWYGYDNDPQAQVRHRSSRHEGVAYLEMDAAQPDRLTGTYYTARKTTGDLKLTR